MTAPEDPNGLREALARYFDGSAFQPAHSADQYWGQRRRDAYRHADALIAGPLASIIAERDAAVAGLAQATANIEKLNAVIHAAAPVLGARARAAEAENTRLKAGMEALGDALKLAENPLSHRNAVDPGGPGSIAVARALDAVRTALATLSQEQPHG